MTQSRLLTAGRIHDGQRFLPEGCAIQVAADGTIIAIREGADAADAEHFEGILCPGFVNAHCHLELSHMKGVIPRGTGLIPFLQAVTRQRAGFSDHEKQTARYEAYEELLEAGVVAVGDIANTTDTLDLRSRGALHVHSFVECIGFTETGAAARLAYAAEVLHVFEGQYESGSMLRQSIVPHAPYSVSPALFRLINDATGPHSILSIHNQESAAEDEYYLRKTGAVRDLLGGFGIDDSFFEASGKSSLQTYLPLLAETHPIILVHNTYSTAEDVAAAESRGRRPFWCLCPGANLYIEGRLPDVEMLHAATDNICIGTDSLASNEVLSPLRELQHLNEAFPQIGWETLLRWGTQNGARALGIAEAIGSFERGKKPGIIQIRSLEEAHGISRVV